MKLVQEHGETYQYNLRVSDVPHLSCFLFEWGGWAGLWFWV